MMNLSAATISTWSLRWTRSLLASAAMTLVRVLHAENVLARRYFYPGCHEMEPYRSYFPHAGLVLPETES